MWRAGFASAEQVPLQHRPDVRRHHEPAVAASLAVVDHGQLDPGGGAVLLRSQHRLLVRLAHLGGDHVEDPLPDLLQLARVVLQREPQQRLLRVAHGPQRRHGKGARRPPPRPSAPAPSAPHPTSTPSRPTGAPPAPGPAPGRGAPRAASSWSRPPATPPRRAARAPQPRRRTRRAPARVSASSCERTSVSATSAACLSASRHERRLHRRHALQRSTEVVGTLDDRMHQPPPRTHSRITALVGRSGEA